MTWDRASVPQAARDLVEAIEGFRAVPYWDGYRRWSIGYGATTDDAGRPVTGSTPPITREQADALLARDMAEAAEDVAAAFPDTDLTEAQAAALISFAYNEGRAALLASFIRRDILAGNMDGAAAAFRNWIFAGGQPSLGLLRRRWAEASVFCEADPAGVWGEACAKIGALGVWPILPSG